ncbi:MAG: hypothetical protein ACYC5O_14475 [Anaerolineae bacterium]
MVPVVCAMLVAACSSVRVVESPTRAAAGVPTAGRPNHDLAILAAEIYPPLEALLQTSAGRSDLQLTVAIENRGSVAERDVIVEAWLRAPGGGADALLLTAKTIVPYVTPGEVEVAKLTASGDIPLLQSYTLEVSVRPVPSETLLTNNTSVYSISVSVPPF